MCEVSQWSVALDIDKGVNSSPFCSIIFILRRISAISFIVLDKKVKWWRKTILVVLLTHNVELFCIRLNLPVHARKEWSESGDPIVGEVAS